MITDAEEIARKLSYIAGLTAGELRGWIDAREVDQRSNFPGERAAIIRRANEIGVKL